MPTLRTKDEDDSILPVVGCTSTHFCTSSSTDDNSVYSESMGESDECCERDHVRIPLRRVGTDPLPAPAHGTRRSSINSSTDPPRRPLRQESQSKLKSEKDTLDDVDSDNEDEDDLHQNHYEEEKGCCEEVECTGDEYDHQKFFELLMGSNNDSQTFCLDPPDLRPRKSSQSAPPKIPHRTGSDGEDEATAVEAAMIPKTAVHRQKSMPMEVFRPRSIHRRRNRRRSKIQDMLHPDSEGSSKSIRLPPRMPSRTGSDSEKFRQTRTLVSQIREPSVPVVVVSKQDDTTTKVLAAVASPKTDAPKRPRRSLSPEDGQSMRSVFKLNLQEIDDHEDVLAVPPPCSTAAPSTAIATPTPTSKETAVESSPCTAQEDEEKEPETPISPRCLVVKKRRKVPRRAQTFNFNRCDNNKKILAKELLAGRITATTTASTTPATLTPSSSCQSEDAPLASSSSSQWKDAPPPMEQMSLKRLMMDAKKWSATFNHANTHSNADDPKSPLRRGRVLPRRSRTFDEAFGGGSTSRF